jgi:predicted transcriptional regulator of viral defense system
MSSVSALASVADLAEAQRGMFTTRQAAARSVERRDLARLADAGILERLAHGVYRVADAPRDPLADLRAAWLQLAPGVPVDERTAGEGVVSHASAAVVHRAGLLDPFVFEFTVPPPRRPRPIRPDVVVHRAALGREDVVWATEILVTSPLRTIADLAASGLDGDHLAAVVADLTAAGEVGRHEVADTLEPYAAAYGASNGADLLAELESTVGGQP